MGTVNTRPARSIGRAPWLRFTFWALIMPQSAPEGRLVDNPARSVEKFTGYLGQWAEIQQPPCFPLDGLSEYRYSAGLQTESPTGPQLMLQSRRRC